MLNNEMKSNDRNTCGAGKTSIAGVALLAESHISIHTWPETGFVAVDLFMCGTCDPALAIPYLRDVFAPKKMQLSEHQRGKWTVPSDSAPN
jgi:S-adenosylmethionine decarboxylase proenzyme